MDLLSISCDSLAPQRTYIAYVVPYKHRDYRTSFPLCFIFNCPPGIRTELNMMYASTKQRVANELSCQKVRACVSECVSAEASQLTETPWSQIFECRDAEELTSDWVQEKLRFFD